MARTPSDDRQRWEQRYANTPPAADAPSPFLVKHAHLMTGRVLDIAGGAGRNALYLARRGCTVDVVDIAAAGLTRLMITARDSGLRVNAVQADLETFPLPEQVYDVTMNFRYLQRSLFESIQRTVKPGGLIVFETFLIDQQDIGHPRNPAFLLQRGELRSAFEPFDIVDYWEGRTDDAQPAFVARMLARRPLDRWD